MKTILSRSLVVLIVVTVFFPSITVLDVKGQDTTSYTKEVLRFLQEVVQLNTTEYYVVNSVGPVVDEQEVLDEIVNYTHGKISLDRQGGHLYSLYSFLNGTLQSIRIRVEQIGWPQSLIRWDNLFEAAKVTLINYKDFLGTLQNNSNIDLMYNLLTKVNTPNSTTIEGNIKLEIDQYGKFFKWTYNYNGVDFPAIHISFDDSGAIGSFSDSRKSYRIGSIEVNFTEEEAIGIALDQAKVFSFVYENGTIIEIGFLEHWVKAELVVKSRYVQKEYYPVWMVDLPLDNIYGQIYFIRVMFWADDGEIDQVKPLGYGGDPSWGESGSLIVTSTPSPSQEPILTPEFTGGLDLQEFSFVPVVALVMIVFGVGIILYFKKRKK